MADTIELDKNYSTTRRVIKADPKEIESLVKQSHNPEDKFETVLFLPEGEGEGRQGEGGLRTKGYFKQSANNKPLITVVTVVYNGEQFLEETILSVINQTYENVEYIIIDGGSTDGTLDIIRKYQHAIDYWVSEKDKGIFNAMNKGAYSVVGSYIYYLNAGDLFFSSRVIEKIFGQPARFENYNLIVGNVELIHHGKVFGMATREGLNVPHQGVFLRKEVFDSISFDESLKIYGDAKFWLEMNEEHLYLPYFVDDVIATFPMDGVGSSPKYIWRRFHERNNLLKNDKMLSLIFIRRFLFSLIGDLTYKLFGETVYFNAFIRFVNVLMELKD